MKKYLTLVLLLHLVACKEVQQKGGDYGFPVSYDLVGNIAKEDLFADNPDIKAINDEILMTSSVNNVHTGIIKTHSISDGFREIDAYGSRGRGPNEFLFSLLSCTEGQKAFVHNLNMSEIATLEVSKNGDTIREIERKRFNYDEKARAKYPEGFTRSEPRDIVKLKSGNWVGLSGLGVNDFFSLWDDNLNFITYFGNAPIAEEFDYMTGVSRLGGGGCLL